MASLAPSPKIPARETPAYVTLLWAAAALACSAILAYWAGADEHPAGEAAAPRADPAVAESTAALALRSPPTVVPRAAAAAEQARAPARRDVGPAARRPYDRSAGRPLCREGATASVGALCGASWVRAQDYRVRLLYGRALAQSDDPARLRAQQLRWQARVDASADKPRVASWLYLERIRELQAELAWPAPGPASQTIAAEPATPLALLSAAPAAAVVDAAPSDVTPILPAGCGLDEPTAIQGHGGAPADGGSCGPAGPTTP